MGAALSMPRKRRHLAKQTLPIPPLEAEEELHEELIMEILSWLPVKTLMRFKCVSKTWNSLVFNPTFIKLHLRRSPRNTHILLSWFDLNNMRHNNGVASAASCSISRLLENPSSTIDDRCHQFNQCQRVIGVYNGLVCFQLIEKECQFQFWNPATNIISEDSPRLNLTHYNSRQCSIQSAFGFDDWSDTYKVVIVILDNKSKTWEVMVHCLGDTCWRNVITFPSHYIMSYSNSQFVSGTVNWLAYGNLSSPINKRENVIFSYDLRKETHRYFPVSDDLFEVLLPPACLGVLKGCLCCYCDYKGTHFVVWLMTEFGVAKSWTQLLNVSYYEPQSFVFWGNCHVMPLCMSENDEDLILLIDGSLHIHYNQRDNRIIDYTDYIHIYDRYAWRSYDYVPSLVLPY